MKVRALAVRADDTDLGPEIPATRITPPHVSNRWLPRPRLNARLGVPPERRLILVTSAAGFGKSSCLAAWCRQLALADVPTAWLTAYQMLTTKGRLPDGGSVLVQGAGGGIATAAVVLANALGARVYATSRDAGKRDRIAALGATALEPGARLPERVDVVVETVGEATFDHSLNCATRGGRIVVSGATSGYLPKVNLRRVFALELEILGSSMGTREELADLVRLCAERGVRPVVDSRYPFGDVRELAQRTGRRIGHLQRQPGARRAGHPQHPLPRVRVAELHHHLLQAQRRGARR